MVKILHLFPKLMNLYGDYANITVLKKHLEDQGLSVKVEEKNIEDTIYFDKYDMIYMGSGSESNQMAALYEIVKYKEDIKACVDKGKVILFTGNAMELLGKYVDGVEALDIFDFETAHTDKRYTGDVIVKNAEFGFAVGFINKSSIISGGQEDKLFDYIFIDNNLNENSYEGCQRNNTFGTHIIGPVLVKNPNFMELIVKTLLPKNKKFKKIKYEYEVDSYIVTLNALKERIQ